jgi:L-alanine-DL-glutamate epimerase-like enolase superfamily enzyme
VRITKISAIVYRQQIFHRDAVVRGGTVARPWHETLLVRIDTEEGLTGWGEAFAHFGVASTTREALEQLVIPRCTGRDAADENLTAALTRELHYLGACASGPVAYAVSGIDLALWDLRGKAAGKPVHALLAPSAAETMPAYASMIRYTAPDVVASECREAVARGYSAVKLHEIELPAIRAAAQALAPHTLPLMVDTNCAWSLQEAQAAAAAMAPLGVAWLEEPIWPPDDHAALLALRRQKQVPVAAGENAPSLGDMLRMIASGAVDYAQPSVTKLGGISALRAVCAAAAAQGIKVAPHSPYFGPGLMATVHVCAALAPDAWIEHLFYDLQPGPYARYASPQAGRFAVPQVPGLGADPDLDALERCRL